MSNYGSSYNISQSGDLYAVQANSNKIGLGKYSSARSTTVNSPLNYKHLKLFSGLDNELYFFVKNQDRKPISLHGMTILANLVNRETGAKIVSKKCQIIDYDQAQIKLIITAGEISTVKNGYFDLVFTYVNELGLNMALYCDTNMRPNHTVEVSDQASNIPLTTAETNVFLSNGDYNYSNLLPSSGYFNKPNSIVTIAMYATDYTGHFYIQGAIADNPTESDWFNIILGTYTEEFYPYIDFTGVDPWTFRTNVKYVRAKWNAEQGTVDKVVVRV